MSTSCWTEKQRALKQHARDTAERRRKWEKIAAEQEEEEEMKLKRALEKRKKELESKNRYLRQPHAKPPPPKRTFLTKGSRYARPGERERSLRDEALTNQPRFTKTRPTTKNSDLKHFIREQRAARKGEKQHLVKQEDHHVVVAVAPPATRAQWTLKKEEAGAELEQILNRYTSCTTSSGRDNRPGPGPGGPRVNTVTKEANTTPIPARSISTTSPQKPPRPPPATSSKALYETVGSGPASNTKAPVYEAAVEEEEEEEEELCPITLRRGCVSTARHRPSPRVIFSADSLDGSAVELKVPEETCLLEMEAQKSMVVKDEMNVRERSEDAALLSMLGQVQKKEEVVENLLELSTDSIILEDSVELHTMNDDIEVSLETESEPQVKKDERLTSSALELKYFGDLASPTALKEKILISGGPVRDTSPPLSPSPKKVEEEVSGGLSWWCEVEDLSTKKIKEQAGIDFDTFEWGEARVTQNTNKNKLPRKDHAPNLYAKAGTFASDLVDNLMESPQKMKQILAPPPPQTVVCMKQTHANYTYYSPNKKMAAFDASKDESLVKSVQQKVKNGSETKVGAIKQANLSEKKRPVAKQKKKEKVSQGVEGPLMCKGSYAQSTQDRMHTIGAASKPKLSKNDNSKRKIVAPMGTDDCMDDKPTIIGDQSPQQMKPRKYKHISCEDMEAFTKPSVVRFTDRLRDGKGMVTTLSMEEDRLRQSLARLDKQYLNLAGDYAHRGAERVNANELTEESLLASLQRLDLHLKGSSTQYGSDYGENSARGVPTSSTLTHGVGANRTTSTTAMGFKKRDVVLPGNAPLQTGMKLNNVEEAPKVQQQNVKTGFVYRNLKKAAPTAAGSSQRSKNVGLTNGKRSNVTQEVGPVGRYNHNPAHTAEEEDKHHRHTPLSGVRGDQNQNTSAPRPKKDSERPPQRKPVGNQGMCNANQPVRRHLGDSGGKIVLSKAARALLM